MAVISHDHFLARIYEEYPELKEPPRIDINSGTRSVCAIIGDRFFKMPIAGLNHEGTNYAREPDLLRFLNGKRFPVPELIADHGDFFVTSIAKGDHNTFSTAQGAALMAAPFFSSVAQKGDWSPSIAQQIAQFIYDFNNAFEEYEVATLGIPQSGSGLFDSEAWNELLNQMEETGTLSRDEVSFMRAKMADIHNNRHILENSVIYNDWKLENWFVDSGNLTVVDFGRVTQKKSLYYELAGLYSFMPRNFADQIVEHYEKIADLEIPDKNYIWRQQEKDSNGWEYSGHTLAALNKKLVMLLDEHNKGKIDLSDVAERVKLHIRIFGANKPQGNDAGPKLVNDL